MSKIEWTEKTWNPITGCTKVSPGCKHCYAETMAKRLQAMGVNGYEHGFNLTIHQDRLWQPSLRNKPTMYFVNSMSDMFHEGVPYKFIDQIMTVIGMAQQHTFQILTKRAERIYEYFLSSKVPMNAWLGVSVEDKKYGVPRIDSLRDIDAGTRFLSIEPLLEDVGDLDLTGIHWVIVGGESGPGARPMKPHWVTKIAYQCEKQNVPFFFKQWGAYGADGVRRSKIANGRMLCGKTYDEMPQGAR